MISLEERQELLRVLKFSDYAVAATFYQRNTGRSIHYRYLEKFIKGLRKCSGDHTTSKHRPLDMYIALAEAYRQRQEQEAQKQKEAEIMTARAREIRTSALAA